MKFKFLNYFSIFLIQAMLVGQNNKIESLDQRKFIAWEVHHMPYHILVEDAIVDFNDLNRNSTKVDTFKTLKPDEQLIIVQNKANDTQIHEIWYGDGLLFTIITRDLVDWVLSQDIQQALIEKDQYLNTPSETVFFESEGERLLSNYSSKLSLWQQYNFYVSHENMYLRSNILQYAVNFSYGNTLIGLPGTLFGGTAVGVATRNSEIGLRFPAAFNISPIGALDDPKYISSNYLGLYSKVNINNMFSTTADFHAQMGFSFFPYSDDAAVTDTTFFKQQKIDPEYQYVNIVDMYALFAASFDAPIKLPRISKVTLSPGLHYLKIAHRTWQESAETLLNRTFYLDDNGSKETFMNDSDNSKYLGLYTRVDLISDLGRRPAFFDNYDFLDFIQIDKAPFFELSFQFISDLSLIRTFTINLRDELSLSMTHYKANENIKGSWTPKSNLFIGFKYTSNL